MRPPRRSVLTSAWAGLAKGIRFASIASRLLPGSCALCAGTSATPLCAACRHRYFEPNPSRCDRCAAPIASMARHCGRCLVNPPAFDASFAATAYAPPADLLVQALKFRAQLPLATVFAQLMFDAITNDAMANEPHESGAAGELVMAVPLSNERLAARGFNQALEIARPLARALQLPLDIQSCVRVRDTAPQSALAPADRRDNMRGAFAVMHRQTIAGKHLLVVDDVMTTGHTLDAFAACLKRHGAARVTNLVFARTPP